jgi:hypothetical protein
MAITGNIKSFYLSSLLQLLSNDKKTGILELTDGSDIVQVYLRNGTIINAFGSSRVERLTNYLRSEGIISEEQLEKSLTLSAHTGKKIGKVLVEQGLVSQELFEKLLHRQIEQTLYSIFLWEQGEFEYRDQEFDLSDQIIASFDTMEIVLEASRRVDEIAQLKQRVPKDNDVLAITADGDTLQKASLKTTERAVLSLINGKRTVKRIIIDSGYDELKVYKTLFSLVTSGLITTEKNVLKRTDEDVPKTVVAQESSDASIPETTVLHAAPPAQKIAEAAEPAQTAESISAVPEPPENAQGPESLFADPGAQTTGQGFESLFADSAPAEVQQGLLSESQEMTLEIEPQQQDDGQSADPEASTETEETLSADTDIAGSTVIKVDGRLLTEVDLPDIELPKQPQFEPVDKNELAEALRQYGADADFENQDQANGRPGRRTLLISGACAAVVIVLAIAALLLKPVFFPAAPEPAPVPPPKAKSAPVKQKKEPVPEKQETTEAVAEVQEEVQDVIEPQQPETAHEFFQDEKGWVSINLPPGYTFKEQSLQGRTSVNISYGNDIRLVLTVMPEAEVWNAEDEMYASIVRMQESGSRTVQTYSALKQAGCPGYMIHYINQREQKSIQTALYRFVCFNKSARLEVANLIWRTEAGRELGQQIYAAIETSFFVYP